jgi:hypothetical protein
VQDVEPGCLAEVGALAADLEGEPLVAQVFFGQGGVAEGVLGVVLLDDVVDDGAGFPENEAGVGVLDGWWVELEVWRGWDWDE